MSTKKQSQSGKRPKPPEDIRASFLKSYGPITDDNYEQWQEFLRERLEEREPGAHAGFNKIIDVMKQEHDDWAQPPVTD